MGMAKWAFRMASLLVLATGAFAGDAHDSAARCKALLPKVEAKMLEYDPERRAGLRQDMIEVRAVCLAPEAEADDVARAAVVISRQGSISFASPKENLDLLRVLNERLAGLGRSRERIEMLDYLGGLLEQEGRPKEALAVIEESLDLRRQVFASASPEVADGMLTLAHFETALGKRADGQRHRDKAVSLGEEALSMIQAEHGRESDAAIGVARSLWGLLREAGVDKERMVAIFAKHGLGTEEFDEDWTPPPGHTPPKME